MGLPGQELVIFDRPIYIEYATDDGRWGGPGQGGGRDRRDQRSHGGRHGHGNQYYEPALSDAQQVCICIKKSVYYQVIYFMDIATPNPNLNTPIRPPFLLLQSMVAAALSAAAWSSNNGYACSAGGATSSSMGGGQGPAGKSTVINSRCIYSFIDNIVPDILTLLCMYHR